MQSGAGAAMIWRMTSSKFACAPLLRDATAPPPQGERERRLAAVKFMALSLPQPQPQPEPGMLRRCLARLLAILPAPRR